MLERVVFDLYKNLLIKDDDDDDDDDDGYEYITDKEIRVFFRLSLIEEYVEKLPEIKIKIFYDKNKCKNSVRLKFPNLGYLDYFNHEIKTNKILKKMRNFYNKYID